MRRSARVKFYNETKGWGFIDDGPEGLFFHASGLVNREEPPSNNDVVSYVVVTGRRGRQAAEVLVEQRAKSFNGRPMPL